MSEVGVFSAIDHHEDEAQRDMRIRGMRLAAFVAKRDSCAWQYQEEIGEWHLVPIMDGSTP